MSTLETRQYVATEQDVANVTKQYLNALASQGDARGTYLKILVGTLQAEFKSDLPTARRASAPPELISAQLKALDTINARFYGVVMATIANTPLPDEGREKVKLRHRRGVFARTSASTLRSWIRSGRDARALDPATVSKRQLILKRPVSPIDGKSASPAKRAVTLADRIAEITTEMAATDREAAAHTLEAAVSRLTQALFDLGSRATTKPEIAMNAMRPLKMGSGLFWPVIRGSRAAAAPPDEELRAEVS